MSNNSWNGQERRWEPEIAHFDIEREHDRKRGFFYCYGIDFPPPPNPSTTTQYLAWQSESGKARTDLLHRALLSVDGHPVQNAPPITGTSVFYENDEFMFEIVIRSIGSAGEQLDDYK
jgi:hypothetical protein